jgi:hypothetical protein
VLDQPPEIDRPAADSFPVLWDSFPNGNGVVRERGKLDDGVIEQVETACTRSDKLGVISYRRYIAYRKQGNRREAWRGCSIP